MSVEVLEEAEKITVEQEAQELSKLLVVPESQRNTEQRGTIDRRIRALSGSSAQHRESVLNKVSEMLSVQQQGVLSLSELRARVETEAKKGPVIRSAQDLQQDFAEGGAVTKVGYVAGGIVGFALLHKVWTSLFGDAKTDGWFKKTGKWVARIAGVVAGVLTFKALRDAWAGKGIFEHGTDGNGNPVFTGDSPFNRQNPQTLLPDSAKGAAEGVLRGGIDAKKFLGEAYEAFLKQKHCAEVIRNKDSYKTETEFAEALLAAAAQDGVGLAWNEAGVFLNVEGKLLSLDWKLLHDGLIEGKLNAGDVLSVYIEGTMLYATSYAALRLLTMGRFGKDSSLLLESGLWPIYIIKRGVVQPVKGLYKTGKVVVNLYRQGQKAALTASRWNANAEGVLLSLNRGGGWMPDGLELRYQFVRDQIELLHKAELSGHPNLLAFKRSVDRSMTEFRKYLQLAQREQAVPEWFLLEYRRLFPNIPLEKLDNVQLGKIVESVNPESAIPPPVTQNPQPGVPATPPPSAEAKSSVSRSSGPSKPTPPRPAETPVGAASPDVSPTVPPSSTPSPTVTSPETVPPAATTATVNPSASSNRLRSTAPAKPPSTPPAVTQTPISPEAAERFVQQHGDVGKAIEQAGGVGPTPQPSPVAAPAETPPAPVAPAVPASPPAAVAETAADAQWQKFFSRLGNKTVQPQDVRALLELAQEQKLITIDSRTLALISRSKGAQKIIAGAIKTTDVAEVTRALRAARISAGCMTAVNAVAVTGDVFAIYMAFADWQANGRRIAATSNPELKELYSHANIVYAAEGTAGAAGLVIQGVAIVGTLSEGGGVLAALGTAGSTIALPITVAAVGGGLYYRALEGVTEEWTKTERDWVQNPEGDLYKRLLEYAPGEHGYVQGAAHATNAEQIWHYLTSNSEEYDRWQQRGFDLIEGANTTMRRRVTEALVLRQTVLSKQADENDAQYQERIKQFVSLEMRYLAVDTGGQFGPQMPFVYEAAHDYAELMTQVQEAKKQGGYLPFEWQDGTGRDRSFDLTRLDELQWSKANADGLSGERVFSAWRSQKRQESAGILGMQKLLLGGLVAKDDQGKEVLHSAGPQGPEAVRMLRTNIAQSLLKDVRFYLMTFDGRLRQETNLPGWEWTGGKDEARNAIRNYVNTLVRGRVEGAAERLAARDSISVEAYEEEVGYIRGCLAQPEDLYKRAAEEKYPSISGQYAESYITLPTLSEQVTADIRQGNLRPNVAPPKQEEDNAIRVSAEAQAQREKCKSDGTALMGRIGANGHDTYYTKQYGTWVNKYLYMMFDEKVGKWMVGLGSLNNLSDPDGFKTDMVGGSASYDTLCGDLAAINRGESPSQ